MLRRVILRSSLVSDFLFAGTAILRSYWQQSVDIIPLLACLLSTMLT
jgi:hypothetical protein